MTFFESVHNVFYKYFQFSGRSVRSEYWYFCLFLFTVNLLLETFLYITGQGILSVIFDLATVIPGLSVACRRLHDVNRSGWWLLIAITIVGLIPLFYWMCKASDNGENLTLIHI